MPKQNQEPGPGRSTAAVAFDDLRKEIAQRNEQATQKARKLRAARDREQMRARRQWELL
ncbi:MAG TPA: hypothetical protein VHW96_07060 [Solirubrobacteraceae bacterium]|jgi:hypothetical protein|nr:hypothetical protein [Solirubrobacteraceae bacterium]